ncbi:hypothetical protein ACBJ59_58715 [Nonomuraea sp. MTCD27]|uniref:hypothetical protein n=1 Tax=Nonomuraea sp. MTCD27 TaxID=1676747 RepID=UPI0035C18578
MAALDCRYAGHAVQRWGQHVREVVAANDRLRRLPDLQYVPQLRLPAQAVEPDLVEVHLDGARLRPEPGKAVIPHGADRDLTGSELDLGRLP